MVMGVLLLGQREVGFHMYVYIQHELQKAIS